MAFVSPTPPAFASPIPTAPNYRPDIDGLRAIAVLAVVVYHAFPDWLQGGFLGVDVFFVISGYLISTILLAGLDQGSFSLAHFYGRRLRRIVPALVLVLLAVYAFGWFNLLDDEYRQLGKHVAAGATFVSNLVLWREAGYFDHSSETKPLLHLWSLGIEEQFYLAWPLLLWLSWKRKLVAAATVVLGLGSLLAAAAWGRTDPVAGFYFPLTRLWELLAGSLLAWASFRGPLSGLLRSWPSPRGMLQGSATNHDAVVPHALALAGAAMLAYGFLFTTGDARFPTTGALAAVAGTACLIAAGTKAWPNRLVLSSRPAVWLGLVSFPLYLWHWPLLSFGRILAGQTPPAGFRAAAVWIAVVLAWATYRLVELPVRFGPHARAKVGVCAALLVLVFCIGRHTYDMDGLPRREVVALNRALLNGDDGWTRGQSVDGCAIADPALVRLFAHCARDRRGNVKYALLGDSKAGVLYSGLVRTSAPDARWMLIGGNGDHGAPIPLVSDDPALSRFQPLTRAAVQALADDPGVRKVVIAAAVRSLFALRDSTKDAHGNRYDHRYLEGLPSTRNYNRVLEGLSETVSRLSAKGKGVVLVVDNPPLSDPQDCVSRRSAWGAVVERLHAANPGCVVLLQAYEAQIVLYRQLLAELKDRHPGAVAIFDPTDIYCDRSRGVCEWARDGRMLYSITDHISDHAAGLVGARLNSFLAQD